MNNGFPIPDIAKREENFYNGAPPTTDEGKMYYAKIQQCAKNIENIMNSQQSIESREEIIRRIFSQIYNFVIEDDFTYSIFDRTKDIYNDIFEACLFISLCMYLHDTKRIKGSSLRKFIYDHSPMGYGVEGSPNYIDYDNPDKYDEIIFSDETVLRKARHRLLSQRPVYNDSVEWSAIRMTSEHEWTLYFDLDEAKPVIRDTAKRMKNLYNDVNKALKKPENEEDVAKLETAYKKFTSKLNKIKYENFLALGKFYLEHINKDKTCYGMDLYRFEKQFRLYGITNGVNRLLECQNDDEIYDILGREILVNNVAFPKLRTQFSCLGNTQYILLYVNVFLSFMNEVVRASRLVIDKFVEEGIFGKDWKNLFLKMTNEMAEEVICNPAEINYSISDKSQEMFSIYLEAPVYANVKQAIQNL